MSALAKRSKTVLPISFFERAGHVFYNSLVVFDADGSLLHPLCSHCPPSCRNFYHCVYRKSHIPTGPGYQEKFFFSPGPDGDCCAGIKAYRSKVFQFNLGIGICWDQWFPELARVMALKGAEILLYPTAIGSEPQDPSIHSRDHWQRVMCGHAGANLMPLIASNRIGKEVMNRFYGSSFIADFTGDKVQEADEETESVLIHEFDLRAIQLARSSWGLLRDRRPELYSPILGMNATGIVLPASTVCAPPSGLPATMSAPARVPEEHNRKLLPFLDGYSMPAEWIPHNKTWMAWPYRLDVWRENAEPAQKAFVTVVEAISSFEPVFVCAHPGESFEKASTIFAKETWKGKYPVEVVEMEYDDVWMRDVGPTFLKRDRSKGPSCLSSQLSEDIRAVDWNFNCWGGKCYSSWAKDSKVALRVIAREKKLRYKCPLIMEGGSIHIDGEGTLLTTEQCLLNPNRNPQSTKEDIEEQLRFFLGIEKFIWLPLGIDGDIDTDGHIDNIACFVRPGEVALTYTEDKTDPQYEISKRALEILEASTDAKGKHIIVHKIIHPPLMRYTEDQLAEEERSANDTTEVHVRRVGDRIAASYVNFYIANGGIVMPGFFNGEGTDSVALQQMQRIFPEREVKMVQTLEVVLGGGNIHCITQQQPL